MDNKFTLKGILFKDRFIPIPKFDEPSAIKYRSGRGDPRRFGACTFEAIRKYNSSMFVMQRNDVLALSIIYNSEKEKE